MSTQSKTIHYQVRRAVDFYSNFLPAFMAACIATLHFFWFFSKIKQFKQDFQVQSTDSKLQLLNKEYSKGDKIIISLGIKCENDRKFSSEYFRKKRQWTHTFNFKRWNSLLILFWFFAHTHSWSIADKVCTMKSAN